MVAEVPVASASVAASVVGGFVWAPPLGIVVIVDALLASMQWL